MNLFSAILKQSNITSNEITHILSYDLVDKGEDFYRELDHLILEEFPGAKKPLNTFWEISTSKSSKDIRNLVLHKVGVDSKVSVYQVKVFEKETYPSFYNKAKEPFSEITIKIMTNNNKVTSKKVAKTASKEIKSPKKVIRTIAASDLSQVVPHRETSKKVASKSAKILPAKSSTNKEKQISASVLSQTPPSYKNKPKKKK